MAGSRSLVVVLVIALLALAAIAAVSADDTGSSITNPIAQSPVEDYEGSDTPVDSAIDDAAEAPDAGSLGGPATPATDSGSGSGSGDPSTDPSTEKTPASAASTVGMAGIAFAATGALVGYLVL